ncbi:hypothetical protein RvY_15702 [Ramazzottius varieornatus]|uniref:Uncharacterized protein n=1 Tax=Ramazzottius varieornatus TaxID=947166 RepID=A0A1D1VVV3_RAMVA|nr:hypothetical protein RvY_15702 [Ramazzottius varieornatus]
MAFVTNASLLFVVLSVLYVFGQSDAFGFATRFRQDGTLPGADPKIRRISRGVPYMGLESSLGDSYSNGYPMFTNIGMPSRRGPGPLQGCDSPKECRERLLNYFSSVMKLNKAGR